MIWPPAMVQDFDGIIARVPIGRTAKLQVSRDKSGTKSTGPATTPLTNLKIH
jgi:hypothetical protein